MATAPPETTSLPSAQQPAHARGLTGRVDTRATERAAGRSPAAPPRRTEARRQPSRVSRRSQGRDYSEGECPAAMTRPRRCPEELLDRGVRLVFESGARL